MFPLAIPLVATLAEAAAAISRPSTATECAVALQVMKDETSRDYGKPVVLSTVDPTYLQLKAESLAQGWTRYEDGKSVGVDPRQRKLRLSLQAAFEIQFRGARQSGNG
jgi:hypothetical protein